MALTDKLTAIADAIRTKGGTTDKLTLAQMPQAITDLPSGDAGLIGKNPVLLDSWTENYTLADTTFDATKTYGTSIITIKSSSLYKKMTGLSEDKERVVIQSLFTKPTFTGAEAKAQEIYHMYYYFFFTAKRMATPYGEMVSSFGEPKAYPLLAYYNTSGTEKFLIGSNYGIYTTSGSTSFSSATVNIYTPSICCRSDASYCSSANIKCITACDIEWNAQVYQVDGDTSLPGMAWSYFYEKAHS